MFSKVFSSATFGIDAYIVEVETNLEKQIPSFTIVGLPDNAVKESRERVTAAIKNSGFEFPLRKITVNLAPADIKKEGSALDLPIALGILSANNIIDKNTLTNLVSLGELSLDGTLRRAKGALPIAVESRKRGIKRLILPIESVNEASIVEGLEVFGMENLNQVINFLRGEENISPTFTKIEEIFSDVNRYHLDFSDVKGQETTKRALKIAAAGGYNIVMI